MSRKGENIRKRKDGRWEGRYTDNTIVKSVYARTYLEAKQKLIKAKAQCSMENSAVYVINFRTILNEWLLMKQKSIKVSSYVKYCGIIDNHLIPYWGEININDITDTLVFQYFIEKLNGDGYSYSLLKTILYVFKSAIQYANKKYNTSINVGYSLPKRKYAEPSLFTEKEISQIIGSIVKKQNEKDLGILISIFCGLRIGESCALQWNDIDIELGILNIKKTVQRVKNIDGVGKKTKIIIDTPKSASSIRKIPLPLFLKDYLAMFKNEKENEDYIISGCKAICEPRSYQYYFSNFLKREKIIVRNYHILRHTFATRCVESGVDIKSLSEILGHSTVNITLNKYVHPSMEQKRIQLEKLCIVGQTDSNVNKQYRTQALTT